MTRPRPRLLLLHGYLSGPAAWDPLRRELGDDAETFAPALPGYGGAPDPAAYTLEALAEALDGTLDEARPDHLLGHSLGAILALELARRHPGRFRRVGLAGLPVFADFAAGLRYVGGNSRVRDRYLRDLATGHARCEWLRRTRGLWARPASLFLEPRFLSVLRAAFDHSAAAHSRGHRGHRLRRARARAGGGDGRARGPAPRRIRRRGPAGRGGGASARAWLAPARGPRRHARAHLHASARRGPLGARTPARAVSGPCARAVL